MYTDNNPLTYVLTTANVDATGHRWLAALTSYNVSILYRPGKSNADADTLSRIPTNEVNSVTQLDITEDFIKATSAACQIPNYIETISMSADVVDDDEDTTSINNMTLRNWRHLLPICQQSYACYQKPGFLPRLCPLDVIQNPAL